LDNHSPEALSPVRLCQSIEMELYGTPIRFSDEEGSDLFIGAFFFDLAEANDFVLGFNQSESFWIDLEEVHSGWSQ